MNKIIPMPAANFRFLFISRVGPVVRNFSSASAFNGYVQGWRGQCGDASVYFQTPFFAVGVIA